MHSSSFEHELFGAGGVEGDLDEGVVAHRADRENHAAAKGAVLDGVALIKLEECAAGDLRGREARVSDGTGGAAASG